MQGYAVDNSSQPFGGLCVNGDRFPFRMTLVRGADKDRQSSQHSRSSVETHGDRFGSAGHAVQHRDADCGLVLLTGQGAGTQLRDDQEFPSAHGRFDQSASPIPGQSLPFMRPFSAMSWIWRSRSVCWDGSAMLGTAEARGGMTTSGGGAGWRALAAAYGGSPS